MFSCSFFLRWWLQAVCSCAGHGVDCNQCRVVDLWLERSRHLQVRLVLDSGKAGGGGGGGARVEWVRPPPPADVLAGVLGVSLLKPGGLPALALTWDAPKGKPALAPNTLNPLGVVPLAQIFDAAGSGAPRRRLGDVMAGNKSGNGGGSSDGDPTGAGGDSSPDGNGGNGNGNGGGGAIQTRNTVSNGSMVLRDSAELPRTIASYMIAQLYLAAEICLDRNYLAMHIIAEQMPYAHCIAIVKTPGLPAALKAAVVRLVTTLYVDVDPQTTIRLPQLTHAYDAIRIGVGNVHGGPSPKSGGGGAADNERRPSRSASATAVAADDAAMDGSGHGGGGVSGDTQHFASVERERRWRFHLLQASRVLLSPRLPQWG